MAAAHGKPAAYVVFVVSTDVLPLEGLRMKSMLNTVCRSYLKHPAREEMLAAHSAERWASGQVA
ncbi:hypothetical protein NQZ68_034399 [Dissostichus eleginoides]|nr:hypothetical protein NQZ68_034399 [Dissostichus eleginoides]